MRWRLRDKCIWLVDLGATGWIGLSQSHPMGLTGTFYSAAAPLTYGLTMTRHFRK
jgi:hypothetical protein